MSVGAFGLAIPIQVEFLQQVFPSVCAVDDAWVAGVAEQIGVSGFVCIDVEWSSIALGAVVVPAITAVVIPEALRGGFGDFAGRGGAEQQSGVLIVGMAPVGPIETGVLTRGGVGDIWGEAPMPVIGVLAEGQLQLVKIAEALDLSGAGACLADSGQHHSHHNGNDSDGGQHFNEGKLGVFSFHRHSWVEHGTRIRSEAEDIRDILDIKFTLSFSKRIIVF